MHQNDDVCYFCEHQTGFDRTKYAKSTCTCTRVLIQSTCTCTQYICENAVLVLVLVLMIMQCTCTCTEYTWMYSGTSLVSSITQDLLPLQGTPQSWNSAHEQYSDSASNSFKP
jgi:hypothetical protein